MSNKATTTAKKAVNVKAVKNLAQAASALAIAGIVPNDKNLKEAIKATKVASKPSRKNPTDKAVAAIEASTKAQNENKTAPTTPIAKATDEMIQRLEKQVKAKKAAKAVKAPKTVKSLTEKHADEIDSGVLWTVWDARQNGASFNQLEAEFGLKATNGNTAYRICMRADKIKAEK